MCAFHGWIHKAHVPPLQFPSTPNLSACVCLVMHAPTTNWAHRDIKQSPYFRKKSNRTGCCVCKSEKLKTTLLLHRARTLNPESKIGDGSLVVSGKSPASFCLFTYSRAQNETHMPIEQAVWLTESQKKPKQTYLFLMQCFPLRWGWVWWGRQTEEWRPLVVCSTSPLPPCSPTELSHNNSFLNT